MLEDGLAAAERTGDEAGAAFGDGVQGVDHPDARLHDAVGTRLLAVTLDGHLDGPFLGHRDIDVFSLGVGEDGDDGIHVVGSFRFDGFDGVIALESERDHDLVGQPAFLDLAQPVGRDDLVAGFRDGREIPKFFTVQGVGVLAALQEDVLHGGEVVLQAVIDAGQQAGTQGDLQHPAFELHLVAALEAAGAFEHLHGGVFPVHLDYLGHHLDAAQVDVADLVLGHRSVHQDGHQVRDDPRNNTCSFH